MNGCGKSDRSILTEEALEQGRPLEAACGEGVGKGPDQGESVTTKQVPDSVPGKGV